MENRTDTLLPIDTAEKSFLKQIDKKLEEMGVAEFYSDSDLKDAMYYLVKDVLAELEAQKGNAENSPAIKTADDKTSAGIQVAIDIIKKRFGISQ